MPKKAKKSIARKYKGSSRSEAEIPPQSQNDPSELNDGITNTSTSETQMDMEMSMQIDWSKLSKEKGEAWMDTMETNADKDWTDLSEVTNIRIYNNDSVVLNEAFFRRRKPSTRTKWFAVQ